MMEMRIGTKPFIGPSFIFHPTHSATLVCWVCVQGRARSTHYRDFVSANLLYEVG